MATPAFEHRAPHHTPCQLHLIVQRGRRPPPGSLGKDPVRRRRREEGQSPSWPPPQFYRSGDRPGIFPFRRMAAAVVGPGGLPPPEGSTARAADDFTGEMKAGMALVGRLHADAAVLMEVRPSSFRRPFL